MRAMAIMALFFATTPQDIFILDFVVGLSLAFYGGVGYLYEHWFDVNSNMSNLHRFLLVTRLVVARCKSSPTAKSLRRIEL